MLFPRKITQAADRLVEPEPAEFSTGICPRGAGDSCFSVLVFHRQNDDVPPEHPRRLQTHYRHVIVLCQAGSIVIHRGGRRRITVHPGEAHWVLPYETHRHEFRGRNRKALVITFERRAFPMSATSQTVRLTPLVLADLAAFMAEYDRLATGPLARRLCLRMEVILCQLEESMKDAPQISEDDVLLPKVAAFVREKISTIRHRGEVARKFGMTAGTLSARMRRAGMDGLGKFITETRFQEARHWLINSDMTIAEVCAFCGFESVPTFVRNFRQRFGAPPARHRRSAAWRPLAEV